MISCDVFFKYLKENNLNFFTGVPDSLLKEICAYVTDSTPANSHVIGANEGSCVAMATGYHLATGGLPLVYLQNSGMGNTINPLLSLTAPEVYSIPMVLLIGWRGEPGVHDEPQHIKQGNVSPTLLEAMDIPYHVLTQSPGELSAQIKHICDDAKNRSRPIAILVKKDTFQKYKAKKQSEENVTLSREAAIKMVASKIDSEKSIILSTTGKISRELYEYRDSITSSQVDFLNVGSMGHVSQIALGVALNSPQKNIYCFDGDGAAIMHMGGLAIAGSLNLENFTHFVFNNAAHDSVGGQPTVGNKIDWVNLAKSLGYRNAFSFQDKNSLNETLNNLSQIIGPTLIEIKVSKGARSDLGRPKTSPAENKKQFMAQFS